MNAGISNQFGTETASLRFQKILRHQVHGYSVQANYQALVEKIQELKNKQGQMDTSLDEVKAAVYPGWFPEGGEHLALATDELSSSDSNSDNALPSKTTVASRQTRH